MSQAGTTSSSSSPPSPIPGPNKSLTLVDDFIKNVSQNGQLNWNHTGTINIPGLGANPGIIQVNQGVTTAGMILNGGSTAGSFNLGSGVLNVNFVVSLQTLSDDVNTYKAYFGMNDQYSILAPTNNGIYFSYTDSENGGDWSLCTINSGTETKVDSLILATTQFVNLGFVVDTLASQVQYTINGVTVGTVTTNLPSTDTSLAPFWTFIQDAGILPASLIDLFYLTYNLTTAR